MDLTQLEIVQEQVVRILSVQFRPIVSGMRHLDYEELINLIISYYDLS